MRWTSTTALLLAAMLASACRDGPPVTTASPSTASPGVAPSSPAASSSAAAAPLPSHFERLDQPCDPAKPETEEPCADGRVVGLYHPADFLGAPPPSATVLTTPTNVEGHGVSYVAVEGERLWIRRVTCAGCRRIMGWSFVGRPAAMTDAQRLDLQRRIGFDATLAPLRTVQAWRAQSLPSIAPAR